MNSATQSSQSSRLHSLILGALFFFSLALAISKSATNILLGLIWLFTVIFIIGNRNFRQAIVSNWRQPLLLPLALYFAAAVIGLIFTENVRDGLGIVNKIFGLFLEYYLVSILLDILDDRKTFQHSLDLLFVFVIGIFALDLIGVATYFGLIGYKKFTLPLAPLHVHHIWFSNLNTLGMYIVAAFLLFSKNEGSRLKKAFFILFLPLASVSVLFSLSRTAWFGIFFTSIVLIFAVVRNKRTFLVTLVSMAFAAALLYFFNGIVHDRINLIGSDITSFLSGNTNTNLGARFLLWKAAFKMFLHNPLFGAGTGDYVKMMQAFIATGEYPAFLGEFNQPHNIYLFALATNGLLGLSALLYIFYQGIVFSAKRLNTGTKTNLFAFVAIAAFFHYLIAGMTDSFLNIQILRYAFGFVLGVCVRNEMQMVQGRPSKNGDRE